MFWRSLVLEISHFVDLSNPQMHKNLKFDVMPGVQMEIGEDFQKGGLFAKILDFLPSDSYEFF